jgi:sirohydrochlorin cobaltochelatase
LSTNSAYLLVFHGSRNQQYAQTISQLANLVQKQLELKALRTSQKEISNLDDLQNSNQTTTIITARIVTPIVEVAVLEFGEVSLAQRIVDFAQKAIALNYQRIKIIPVFLSAGVHVKEDLPREIASARQKLESKIVIELLDYVGSYPQLTDLLTQKLPHLANLGRIILAHGSRLDRGNIAVEEIGKKVNAINAYWTVPPDLNSTIELLINHNKSAIVIVPYFLFVGRITEEITSQVATLQSKFPQTKLFLTQPLGATPELAQVIVSFLMSKR